VASFARFRPRALAIARRDAGVLVVEPKSALSAEDFREVSRSIGPCIREKGKLTGLLIEAASFPGWDSFGALIEHLKFVHDHHRNIDRVAVVTDAAFLKIAPTIAQHFAHPEIRVFASGERMTALEWLQA
jgi:stage II sporulation SpoAA-like protein